MSVSKNKGTPKWMVKIMENPIKMDDLGVPIWGENPLFLETPISRERDSQPRQSACESSYFLPHFQVQRAWDAPAWRSPKGGEAQQTNGLMV